MRILRLRKMITIMNKDYERTIKNNMAQALVNKIIFHLSKY